MEPYRTCYAVSLVGPVPRTGRSEAVRSVSGPYTSIPKEISRIKDPDGISAMAGTKKMRCALLNFKFMGKESLLILE